ncbi:MAG: ComEC/Rec2 family competence protein [Candidatus Zixiibacteriota bacterium]
MLFSKKALIVSIFIIILFAGCSEKETENEINGLEIHAINVGQGDCTLIIAPNGKSLLIDAGKNYQGNNQVVPYLRSQGIDSLQYIIATHYHADHIGGIDEVLEEIPVSRFVFDHGGGDDITTRSYADYIEAIGEKRMTINQGDGYLIALDDDVIFECVASNGNGLDGLSENDKSVCIVVRYGDFDYFIGGDLNGVNSSSSTDIESMIADDIGEVDGLKLNHHGSSSSSNRYFLETLEPQFAVIPCGSNSYGHPHTEVIARLTEMDIDYFQTEASDGELLENDILIITDGFDIFLEGSRSSREYVASK